MSVPLSELVTPLTVDEIRTSIYTVLGSVGVNTTVWKPGAVVRTMITACCLVLAAMSNAIALIASSGFLSLANGPWLALCSQYVFGVTVLPASFAAGNVTLNNTGGGVYGPFAPNAVTFSSTVTGLTYQNTATFSVGAMQAGVVVAVQAVQAGSASTANAGDIATIVSPNMLGVLCTNVSALVGADAESDPALKQRSTNKLGALSPNGPRDAYSFVARSAGRDANGNPVLITAATPGQSFGVTRTRAFRDGVGGLDVYVANASGGVPGTASDTTTDLGAIDYLLNVNATPLTVTERTHSATPVVVSISYEIWLYQTSLTDAQVTAAVTAALTAFFPARPIGGDVVSGVGAVWVSGLEALIGSATTTAGVPLGIFRTNVISPSVDVVLTPTQCPVLGTVTAVAIHRIPSTGL